MAGAGGRLRVSLVVWRCPPWASSLPAALVVPLRRWMGWALVESPRPRHGQQAGWPPGQGRRVSCHALCSSCLCSWQSFCLLCVCLLPQRQSSLFPAACSLPRRPPRGVCQGLARLGWSELCGHSAARSEPCSGGADPPPVFAALPALAPVIREESRKEVLTHPSSAFLWPNYAARIIFAFKLWSGKFRIQQ